MNGSGLAHRAVRDYLRDLDRALAELPAKQVRELKDQIKAHLDEALGPDASYAEAAQVLRKLGSPADVAAEAQAGGGEAVRPRLPLGRRLRASYKRMSWGRRVTIAVVLLVVLGLATRAVISATQRPVPGLRMGMDSAWWYLKDGDRAKDTSADGAEQTTVPIRSNQRQGIVISIDNPSSLPQTVLREAVRYRSPGGPPGRITMSTWNPDTAAKGFSRSGTFLTHGTIPPHQTRELRFIWISTGCQVRGSEGGIDSLGLIVRVGGQTRLEVIHLGQGWFLSGPSQGKCL